LTERASPARRRPRRIWHAGEALPAGVFHMIYFLAGILAEAGLSFLGLGVQPPTPTWGGILAEGRLYLANAWWLTAFPGLAIMLTVLSINVVGDWLRDALDPRSRQ
ncbi:MAG: ABC transporter permease subunit, partial [Armatimonadetes bacterium]|nr:ABC transporter permease subunit [Armatimonadota bacterium]